MTAVSIENLTAFLPQAGSGVADYVVVAVAITGIGLALRAIAGRHTRL